MHDEQKTPKQICAKPPRNHDFYHPAIFALHFSYALRRYDDCRGTCKYWDMPRVVYRP